MAKISRKDLKHDRFAEEVGQSVLFVSSHRKQLLFGVIGLILLVAGLLTWVGYRSVNKQEARFALKKGIDMYHGTVDTEPTIGAISFPTTIARFRDTREQLDTVIVHYPGGEEEIGAVYYLALLDIEQKRTNEAKTRLEGIISGGVGEYTALVRLVLAGLYTREKEYGKASEHYRHLVDNPTRVVSKQRSQLAWASLLVQTDPEMAKTLLDELKVTPGPVRAQATRLLRKLEGS